MIRRTLLENGYRTAWFGKTPWPDTTNTISKLMISLAFIEVHAWRINVTN